MKMTKNDLPVEYRTKNGLLQYRIVTKGLPFWNVKKYMYFGWHYIWVFKAEPLDVIDTNLPEHWYAVSETAVIKKFNRADTFGKMNVLIKDINNFQEEIFLKLHERTNRV